MLRLQPISKVRALAAKADLRLIGIGQMDQNAQVFVDGFVTRQELFDMMRRGAAGELTGWAFDADGHIFESQSQITEFLPPPYRGNMGGSLLSGSGDGWNRRALSVRADAAAVTASDRSPRTSSEPRTGTGRSSNRCPP